MNQYLIDTFRFNDWANKLTLEAMRQMPDNKESVNLFSHIIRAQDKWMRRIEQDPAETEIKWFDAAFPAEELNARWDASLNDWLKFLSGLKDEDLNEEIRFAPMPDEPEGVNLLRDVVLQLNYHSILHRAQICLRLHDQKIEPPHVDYIYYVQEG
ncbi:MAG TPA: DinB family protein [Pyrinomonadaceae bacterium]